MGSRGFVVAGVVGALLCGGVATAAADGGQERADIHVAQTLGDRELTVVIRRTDTVPGPLRVDVVTHAGDAPGRLGLRLVQQGRTTASAPLDLGERPGPHGVTLRLEQTGPAELALDDGGRTALIPFVVPAIVLPVWQQVSYGGFVAAGVLLLVALVVAVRARRGWPALVAGGGVVAAIAVGSTAALLSATVPPPTPPGTVSDPLPDGSPDPWSPVPVDTSRPPVNLAVGAPGATAGAPAEVTLSLADGSTGRPADDLLVHHNALMHLVVVSPSGRMWHVHPVRVAPGEYAVRFTPSEPGRYGLAAELARRGGGMQLVRGSFDVGGTAAEPAPAPGGLGPRTVGGQPVELTSTGAGAGAPTTFTARFGDRADLQPWLGMVGHLIVVGPLPESGLGAAAVAAPVWAHVHAMVPPTAGGVGGQPDETVAAYGPEVRFTYTFPAPGRYRLWFQAERDYGVLTVPAVLDVGEGQVR
ncbi:hypothetical protein [Amycolatopsis suaedae]|uniref:hypothetical protein n=1 Tax=Amycolatopsis suaedae TaxID=2510978 RepID=UPI001F0E7084|nr:hypothetical protein [Amycolatopsis suaedae]